MESPRRSILRALAVLCWIGAWLLDGVGFVAMMAESGHRTEPAVGLQAGLSSAALLFAAVLAWRRGGDTALPARLILGAAVLWVCLQTAFLLLASLGVFGR